MRTTVSLDDDVLAVARSIARAQGRSLGNVLSELARRGLNAHSGTKAGSGGFPVFRTPGTDRPITSEAVRAALDET